MVALGGGHGLYASLSALRRVTRQLTAVVTVADDGGSSGRLRREFGVLPPGDLRMALAALCGDDSWGTTWSRVVQHRFTGDGDLGGHAVGNVLIVALWELLGDTVQGLDWVGPAARRARPGAAHGGGAAGPRGRGRRGAGSGQAGRDHHRSRPGGLRDDARAGYGRSHWCPRTRPPAPRQQKPSRAADWVVLGPGSWFTSVLPHLLVPELAEALPGTPARRLVALNLAPQAGETEGFSPHAHLEVLADHAPELQIDVVLADRQAAADTADELEKAAGLLGGRLVLADLAMGDGSPRHDPLRLAGAFAQIFEGE